MKFRPNLNYYHAIFFWFRLSAALMAPNQILRRVKQAIRQSSLYHRCPVGCERRFRSKGGLTKHLNTAHPSFDDANAHQYSPPSNREDSYQSDVDLHSPDTPPRSQPSSPNIRPSVFTPASPEHSYVEDVDMDRDSTHTGPIPSSRPESVSSPRFSVRSNPQVEHSNIVNQMAREPLYSRIYHRELNGM